MAAAAIHHVDQDRLATGRVSWFNRGKEFGFVVIEGGMEDAFLHLSVLKAAGFEEAPEVGTTVRVRLRREKGRLRVVEVLDLQTVV